MIRLESKNFSVARIKDSDFRNDSSVDLINKLKAQQELINALVRDLSKLNDEVEILKNS